MSLLRLESQQQRCLKTHLNEYFSSLSYSLGIETINTFIRARSVLENHTRFQTKMEKVYARFQTKKAQKLYPLGRHIHLPVWIIEGLTPPPPTPPSNCLFSAAKQQIVFLRVAILFMFPTQLHPSTN